MMIMGKPENFEDMEEYVSLVKPHANIQQVYAAGLINM